MDIFYNQRHTQAHHIMKFAGFVDPSGVNNAGREVPVALPTPDFGGYPAFRL